MHETPLPDVYGGFGTSLRFYGVDFSIGCPTSSAARFSTRATCSTWTPPAGTSTGNNTTTTCSIRGLREPRFEHSAVLPTTTRIRQPSRTRFLTSASYLNIQNITLGYTLPKRITRKVPRRESAYSLRLRQCMVLVQASGSRPASGHQRNHEPSTTTPRFAPSRAVCNRNVLIC